MYVVIMLICIPITERVCLSLCVCMYVSVFRLKGVLEQMDHGVVDLRELRRNLELAAAMLDAVYTDETR